MSIEAASLQQFAQANAQAVKEHAGTRRTRAAERAAAKAEFMAELEEIAARRAEGIRALFVDITV